MTTSTPTPHVRFYDTLRLIGRTQRADRVVRPYRTFCNFADGSCNFAIARRRVDVGIDPYRGFALSPFGCAFLRLHSAQAEQSPSPTLRRNVAAAQKVQPFPS